MSMKIYGGPNTGPISEIKRTQRTDSAKGADKAQPQDKVDFSSILQGVTQTKGASAVASTERAEKVNTLKEQVANGSYQPDLHKVAASLLRFLVEEK